MKDEILLKSLIDSKEAKKLIKELSFEQGLKLLEELVDKVESGELSLENSIEAYEKGTFIIERLRAELFKAEKKLKILDKDSDEKS